jgi:hypothetical protein
MNFRLPIADCRFADFSVAESAIAQSFNLQFGKWQRLDQNRVHQTEDRGVGANPKRQCENCDNGKAWMLQ